MINITATTPNNLHLIGWEEYAIWLVEKSTIYFMLGIPQITKMISM